MGLPRRGSLTANGRGGAAAASLSTQTVQGPTASEAGPSFRVPRAHGLVGVGVGPADQGIRTYNAGGVGGPPGGGLIDLSSVVTWRYIIVGLAILYVAGFHITLPVLGRVRI